MSSYLNFYLLPKGSKSDNPKKLLVYSVSRSSDLYQAFVEHNIAYAYNSLNDDEEQYTKLTSNKIRNICEDYYGDISKAEVRLNELDKHANGNPDIIQDIIETKEYLKELQETYHILQFIKDIVDGLDIDGYCDFEGLYVNID